MTLNLKCISCVPEIDYKCQIHREENQCVGCNRTNQKLIVTGIGIICKECARREGLIFV